MTKKVNVKKSPVYETIEVKPEWRQYLDASKEAQIHSDELKKKIEEREKELSEDPQLKELVAEYNLSQRKAQTNAQLLWGLATVETGDYRIFSYNEDKDVIEIRESEVGKIVE